MTKIFDKKAKNWDKKSNRIQMANKFADYIKQSLAEQCHSVALDYGCGTGNVSMQLINSFDKIILADSSNGMIDEVKKKINQLKLQNFKPIVLNLEREDYPNKFDAIYTLMTLHHIKNIELVINKFTNMLNSGGILFIGDLTKEDGNFHSYPENRKVHFGFEKTILEETLLKNNLKITNYKEFHTIIKENEQSRKEYTLFVLSACKIKE